MKTFNEGDRVSHPSYGEGSVVSPYLYPGDGWYTVNFDNGGNVMTAAHLLTPVPVLSGRQGFNFKAGDRVTHQQYGPATVTAVEEFLKLVTIKPDDQPSNVVVQVHPISLIPAVVPKFKIGDRVSHRLHRDGTVEDYDAHSGLYTVGLGGSRAYRALEHQIEPAKPAQKFNVQIMYARSGGFATGGMNSGPMSKAHAEGYLTQLPDWDNVESITIHRAKG